MCSTSRVTCDLHCGTILLLVSRWVWRELRKDGNKDAGVGFITSHKYDFIYLDSIQQNKIRVDKFVNGSIYSRQLLKHERVIER